MLVDFIEPVSAIPHSESVVRPVLNFKIGFNVLKSVIGFVASLSIFFFLASCSAQEQSSLPTESESATLFEEKIRPILVKYCADCHAPGEMKHLDFLTATTHSDIAGLRDVYTGVLEAMENRTMPPGDSDLSDTERKHVVDWIKKTLDLKPGYFDRIAQYVVEPYEDKKGNLWFGTMHKGVARYDGKTLTWFSEKDGLPSTAVPSFAEDNDGNLWVGTHDGVCKFNGKTFTRVGSAEGLPDRSSLSPMASASVRADSTGNIWAGMGRSVFRYDGKSFAEFKIPIVKEKITSYAIVAGHVSMALEDRKGNLWFNTDGDGAYKFDGNSFTHYTKKDGLCSNNVTSILEDQQGRIWFTCIQSFKPEATGDGGVCHFDGKTFTKFPKIKGLSENDIYTIYKTKAGNIWIGATHVGAYRYDGETFTLFSETDRNHWTRNFGVQGIVEDRNGTLWFGFSGGLFRFNGKSFFNVTIDGRPRPITTSEQASESDVDALLKQLQPSTIVVDGDPIETTTLAELMREHQVPGVSIAVIRNGKIDWARGFGIADVESGRKVTTRTLFQAASISKPVAAAAALSMVQDGLLDLDEDVNLKLKSWKVASNEFTDKQPVTLRHLLSHTAGTTVHGFPGYARDANWPSTIDILEGRGNTDPVRVDTLPGRNWRYSGGGYTIIGQLMEDVAGKPYPEILRERVLEPAGMTHSTYVQPLPLTRENDATTAYAYDGSPIKGRYHNYPEIGAAGLWTTAEDLARFALAIQQSRAGKPNSLLSPRLIKEMLTPGKNNWGLGPALSENGDRFGHGGANEGFRSNMSASLDDGWGIVVLTNGDGGGPLCELVRMAASKAYGWSAYEPTVRKRVDIGDAALARIAGTYECLPEWSHARSRLALFPNMGTLEFKAINGRLIADVPEGRGTEGPVEFLPQSEFQVMQRRNGRLMDFIVEDGQVTGFKFRGFEASRVQELGRMWTFENPPLAYLEKEYGFKPDKEWLNSLRLGSLHFGALGGVEGHEGHGHELHGHDAHGQEDGGENVLFGGGSASFVSPKGLIMTSARCVRDAVAESRPRDLDIINTGFVAAAQEQEFRLRLPFDKWLTAAQLNKISNVTDEVNKGVLSTDNETQIKEKRDANKQSILDAARKADPKLVPQIVSLYQGAVVQLYQYKVYNDVRLVVLPHVQTARFGGDQDNFTYPRYSLDFAFLRVYEDGKPADTSKHYFKWQSGGAKKDELVFVSGNPGTTKRMFTKAQMELERDIRIPMQIEQLTNELRNSLEDPHNLKRDAHWASVRLQALKLENSIKAARGNLNGLMDANLIAQKTAAEKAFKGRVMADEELAKKYGDLWDRIASVVEQRRQHEPRAQFQTAGIAVLEAAVHIVRLCDPTESEEHRKHAKKKLEAWAGGTPNYFAKVAILDHFVRAHNWLPDDDPYFTKVLGGKNAEEFLEVMSGSLVRSSDERDALVKSGWKGILESEEPAIVAARELVPLIRKNEQLGKELDAMDEMLRAEMARALFACYGTNVSPDATMTLRFTDGVVKGVPSNGRIAPHRTTLHGLYDRNAEFDNEYPFNLPKIWLDRKDKIDMTKSVNFVSTNDITSGDTALRMTPGGFPQRVLAGSSGSVVVNKELEVVGVVVDGNIESLHNDFVFRDDVPRAVSVHVDGIMEALVKIYDAHRVAKELTGK